MDITSKFYTHDIVSSDVDKIKIDDSWEPEDDDIMNGPGMEGGISYGGGNTWQGR